MKPHSIYIQATDSCLFYIFALSFNFSPIFDVILALRFLPSEGGERPVVLNRLCSVNCRLADSADFVNG